MIDIESFLTSGELFDGRYKLIRRLSEKNSNDNVWLAIDVKTIDRYASASDMSSGRLIAIKICFQDFSLDLEQEQRLQDEFEAAHQCLHANLIPPEEYAIFGDIYYLVFPYQERKSLRQLVRKGFSAQSAWKLIHDMASGLDALHSYQPTITHQNINPSNIIVLGDDSYALTHYGLNPEIHIQHDLKPADSTTAYMAPEQFGVNATFSPPSDIWALGATLYELFTGQQPFGTIGGNGQNDDTPLPPLPDQDPEIRDLVYACLQADPKKRPTARQIKDAALSKQSAANRKKKNSNKKAKATTDERHGTINGKTTIMIAVATILLIVTVVIFSRTNHDKKPIGKGKDIEVVNSYDKARSLLMEKNTAPAGLKLLDSLATAKNWEALLLMSRLYFDTRGVDTILYDKQWEQMRINCGITPNNISAHKYLYDAFTLNENDFIILYHLACDYKAGPSRTGRKRELDHTLWCIDQAEHILNNSELPDLRYRQELEKVRQDIPTTGHSPVKPSW